MDHECNCAPDDEFLFADNLNGFEFAICGLKKNPAFPPPEPLHGEITIEHGHHDLTIFCFASDRNGKT